tara:strand:- start:1721 stop:2749 length:1029 start_codon:yes stop_codon:yes gene_type:complete
MVNYESFQRLIDCGRYPNLISQTDIDNVKTIEEAQSELLSSKNRLGSGVCFRRDLNSGDDTVKSYYGFYFSLPTGVPEWQSLATNQVYSSPLFNFLGGYRVLFFDPSNPTEVYQEQIDFEPIMLFSKSVEELCRFVQNITNTYDTSELHEVLSGIDGLSPENYNDFALNYLIFDKNKSSVQLHLYKSLDNEDNCKDFMKKITKSDTSQFAKNVDGIFTLMSTRFVDPNSHAHIAIEFGTEGVENPDGIYQKIGFATMPRTKKTAPEGSQPSDNYGKYMNLRDQYFTSLHATTKDAASYTFMPTDWESELNQWEDEDSNVFGTLMVEATPTGSRTTICYGFDS